MPTRSYLTNQIWTPFVNATQKTIPPMSCVVITGQKESSGGRNVPKAELTASDYGFGAQWLHRITWHQATPPGKTGRFCLPLLTPVMAVFDDEDGTPEPGELWGPIKDGAKLRKAVGGYRIIGKPKRGERNDYARLVLFEPLITVRGTLTEELEEDGEALVKPYKMSTDEPDEQHTASKYHFKVIEDLGTSVPIAEDTRIRAIWDTGRQKFAVVAAGCT